MDGVDVQVQVVGDSGRPPSACSRAGLAATSRLRRIGQAADEPNRPKARYLDCVDSRTITTQHPEVLFLR